MAEPPGPSCHPGVEGAGGRGAGVARLSKMRVEALARGRACSRVNSLARGRACSHCAERRRARFLVGMVTRCPREHGLRQLAGSEPGDTRGREMSWVGRERGNLGAAGQEAGEAGVLCCGAEGGDEGSRRSRLGALQGS